MESRVRLWSSDEDSEDDRIQPGQVLQHHGYVPVTPADFDSSDDETYDAQQTITSTPLFRPRGPVRNRPSLRSQASRDALDPPVQDEGGQKPSVAMQSRAVYQQHHAHSVLIEDIDRNR